MASLWAAPLTNSAIAVAVVALLAAGCAEGPVYDPALPVPPVTVRSERLAYLPLVPQLPITAGVYYPPEWRLAETNGWASGDPRVRFKLGTAAMSLFDQHAAALFERVLELPSWPPTDLAGQAVDIILVPRLEQSPDAFFAFTVTVDVISPNGDRITTAATKVWYIPEIDASRSASPTAPERIAQIRLKETLAAVLTNLVGSGELDQWARARGTKWHWPAARTATTEGLEASGLAIVQRKKQRNFRETAETAMVGESLKKLDPKISVVPAPKLIDALYPWLSSADLSDTALVEWVRQSAIVERAGTIGVRYLVVARTLEAREEEHGAVAPIGGFGAVGFFGLMWWSQHEVGDMYVLDLVAAKEASVIAHTREVITFALPAFILPLPIPILRLGDSMADAVARQLLPLVRSER